MNADVVWLPWPQVGEAPACFRDRFTEWRRTREPVDPPSNYDSGALQQGRVEDPAQLALPFGDLSGGDSKKRKRAS